MDNSGHDHQDTAGDGSADRYAGGLPSGNTGGPPVRRPDAAETAGHGLPRQTHHRCEHMRAGSLGTSNQDSGSLCRLADSWNTSTPVGPVSPNRSGRGMPFYVALPLRYGAFGWTRTAARRRSTPTPSSRDRPRSYGARDALTLHLFVDGRRGRPSRRRRPMPRNQSTAAQRARAAQRATGAKYTSSLRQATAGTSPVVFSLRELLAECTTSPEWTGDHPEVDAEWAPRLFGSALLGGPVPHKSVLRLTGYLAAMGLSAEMTMESRDGFNALVVACGGRRFQLVLSQDDWVAELCLIPGCKSLPVAEGLVPYCEHRHLTERSEAELAKMAWAWGNDRRQEFERTPAAAHVGDQGDALIVAAVVQGAFSKVAAELVEGCYGDPDLIDDIFPGDETAIRHAIDNEHQLLKQRAWAAAAHIRKLAGGRCECGATLSLAPEADVPARYCSVQCASSTATSTVG